MPDSGTLDGRTRPKRGVWQRIKQVMARLIADWLREYEEHDLAEQKRRLLADLQQCGEGVRLNGHITFRGAEKATFGDNVHLNDNSFIDARAGLTIGDNTHIARNLVLFTTNHNYRGASLPYDDTLLERPVWIGRNVWIGMNVCILPGTKIGDGAIVGMGTTVFGEVPEQTIIGASRWQVLGTRDKDHYDRLESQGRYGGFNGRPLWRDAE